MLGFSKYDHIYTSLKKLRSLIYDVRTSEGGAIEGLGRLSMPAFTYYCFHRMHMRVCNHPSGRLLITLHI